MIHGPGHNLSQLRYFRSLSLRKKLIRRFREMRKQGRFVSGVAAETPRRVQKVYIRRMSDFSPELKRQLRAAGCHSILSCILHASLT